MRRRRAAEVHLFSLFSVLCIIQKVEIMAFGALPAGTRVGATSMESPLPVASRPHPNMSDMSARIVLARSLCIPATDQETFPRAPPGHGGEHCAT